MHSAAAEALSGSSDSAAADGGGNGVGAGGREEFGCSGNRIVVHQSDGFEAGRYGLLGDGRRAVGAEGVGGVNMVVHFFSFDSFRRRVLQCVVAPLSCSFGRVSDLVAVQCVHEWSR